MRIYIIYYVDYQCIDRKPKRCTDSPNGIKNGAVKGIPHEPIHLYHYKKRRTEY